ncbi:hypothetical protein [Nocardiopsis deserti]|uniref:hypothetical protein n=1 Tax=Nocardiopsis deserti TaxID=2605988 RepID=UPI001238EB9D|nr:hypothetical protein [Nocardiopsis deserti]
MRLKNYLIVAGFAAAALFGGSPAWADDAIAPSGSPASVDCPADPSQDPAPPAEESGAGVEPCEDSAPPAEEAGAPAQDEAADQEAEEAGAYGQAEAAEQEAEEAGEAVPVPADPNYTG